MARGAGHDLNGLGDQIIAKLEEIYNKEVQINNTTVAPKTDASGLEKLSTAADAVQKNIDNIGKQKVSKAFDGIAKGAQKAGKEFKFLGESIGEDVLSSPEKQIDLLNRYYKRVKPEILEKNKDNFLFKKAATTKDMDWLKTIQGSQIKGFKGDAQDLFRMILPNKDKWEESFFKEQEELTAKDYAYRRSLYDAITSRIIDLEYEEYERAQEEEKKEQVNQKQVRREKAKQKALNRVKKRQTDKTTSTTAQTQESVPEEAASIETVPVTPTTKTKKKKTTKKNKKNVSKPLEQAGTETVQDTQEVIADTVQQGAEKATQTDTKQWAKDNYKSPDKKNFLIKPVRQALEENYKQNGEQIVEGAKKFASKLTNDQLIEKANRIPNELKESELRIAKKFQEYGKDNRTNYKTKKGEATKSAAQHMEEISAEMDRYNSQRASLAAIRQEIDRRGIKQTKEQTKQEKQQATKANEERKQANEEKKQAQQGATTAKNEAKRAEQAKTNAEKRATTVKQEAKKAEQEAKKEERTSAQSGSGGGNVPPSNAGSPPNNPPGGGGGTKPPSNNWDEFTKIDKEEFDEVLKAYRLSGHKNAKDEIKEIRKNVSAKKDNVATTYGVVDTQGNIVTGEMKRGRFIYDSQGQRTTSKYAPPQEKQTQSNTSRDATNLKQVNNLLEKQKNLYAEIQQLKTKINMASATGATQQETDKLKQELEMRQNAYNNTQQLIQDLKQDSSKDIQKEMQEKEKETSAFEKSYLAYQKSYESNYQRIQDAVSRATALGKEDPLLAQANQLMQRISDPKAMGISGNNGKDLAKNIKAETDAIVKSLQERNNALNAQNVGKNREELLGQKEYLSQLGYGQLDEESLKVGSDGTATLKFIQELGDYAVTTTLKIKDLNTSLQQMKDGTYQDFLKTGQDAMSMQAKGIKQTNDTYEKFMKPYIKARAKQNADLFLTSGEEQLITQFDEQYGKTDPNARAAVNEQVMIDMANELTAALNKAFAKSGEKVDAYRGKIEELRSEIQELKNMGIDLWNADSVGLATTKFGEIQGGLRAVNSKDYDYANPASISNLQNRMQKWASFNTKAMNNSEYKDRYDYITQQLDTNKTKASVRDVRKLGMAFDQLSIDVNEANMAGYSFGDMWKQRLTNFGTYLASYASMYRIWATIKQGISTVTELDTALTEMRKVSDESLASLKQYQTESFNLAGQVGTTALQIQNSTADWMRLGESMDEASKSAQASSVLMNVSEFQSIDEATTSLVSMSSAYSNMDKMDIIDKLNNIGNHFSISTDGIATALQNSASALTTANNDIDEAIALITAGNAVVQDPNKVGAGIRTIALRIQGTEEAKEELQSLGENTDDYIVGTKSKINEQVKAFTAVASNEFKGVSLLDDNGNYRSTYEILQDIADIYDEIQETDKKYGTNHEQGLLELLAGKNRSNIAASILQNGEMLRDVYESSQMSAGSAQEENEKYLDSVNGKMAQMKNEFQEIAFSTLDSDSLKGLISGATKFLDILNKIIEAIGSLPTLLSAAFAGFSTFKGYGLLGKGDKSLTGNLWSYFTQKTYTLTGSEKNFFSKTLGATGDFSKDNIEMGLARAGSSRLDSWVTSLGQGNKAKGIDVLSQQLSKETDAAGQARTAMEQLNEQQQSFQGYAMGATGGATKFQTALSGLKSVATTVGSTLLNMGIAMAASWAIGKGIQWISDYIHREEIAIEKGQEAQSALESSAKAYNDVNTAVSNLSKTYGDSNTEITTSSEAIDSLTKKYYELKKGVNATSNENISLSDEDYQSYLDISNQLASTFPSIKSGTDAAGNAILNMGNNAGEASSQLKELLETERAIANMEIEKNLITSFKGAKASVKQYQEDIDEKETEVSTKKKEVQNVDLSGVQKDISDENYKIVREIAGKYLAKENKSVSAALAEATKTRVEYEDKNQKWWAKTSSTYDYKNDIDFSKLKQQFDNEENWEAFVREAEGRLGKARKDTQTEISKTQSEIDSLTSKQKNDYNQQIENIKSLLQSDSTFAEANADLTQGIINSLKDNESMTFEKLFGEDGKSGLTDKQIVDHIYDNIIDPLSELSKPAQDALVQALSLDANTLSYSGYESQINTLLQNAFPKDETSQKAWKDRLGLDKMVESYDESFQAASKNVSGLDNELKSLSGEDLQLVAKMDADKPIKTLTELKSKIQELRQEAEPPVPVTIEEAITQDDSTFKSAQEAQESANSGATYDTMFSMYKNAKELVEKGDIGTDDFQKIAAMFSPSGAKDLENWNENLGKISKYFTEDNSGIRAFLKDLKSKGYADFDESTKTWALNFKDMEAAARNMGIGYEPFLAILGELKDKGFTNDFFADAQGGGQLLGDLTNQLYEAQKELDDLNTYDPNNKTAIKAKEDEIESLEERIESTSKSLDELLNKEPDKVVIEKNGARDKMQERLSAFNKTSKQYTDGEGKQAMKTYGDAVVQALQKEGFTNAGLRETKDGAWKIDLDVNTKGFETKSKYRDVKKGGEEDRRYYNKNKDVMTQSERETFVRDWSSRQKDKGNINAGENIRGNLVKDTEESNQKVIDQYLDLYESGKDYSEMQDELTQKAKEQGTTLDDWIKRYAGDDAFENYQRLIKERGDIDTKDSSAGIDSSSPEGKMQNAGDKIHSAADEFMAAVKIFASGGNPDKGDKDGKNKDNKPKDNPLTPNKDESKKDKPKNKKIPELPVTGTGQNPIPFGKKEKEKINRYKQNKETAEGHDKHYGSSKQKTPLQETLDIIKNSPLFKGSTPLAGLSSVADLLFPTVHANAAEVDAEHNYDNYQIPLDESINAYCEELDRAKEANVDFSKTVYGNIDTDTRQKLYWTDENKERFGSAASSWGIKTNQFGSQDYSTVLGMWGNFGQESIPIAFTPMLQTENGTPELLNQNTVYDYIDNIVAGATEDGQINPLKLFDLDAQGMDINGQYISNLIAGIGDEADLISQQMHFSGTSGSLFGIAEDIQQELNASGISLDEFLETYGDKIPDELKKALTEAKFGEGKNGNFEIEMDVDQKKVEKKLKKLKKGESMEITADVEGVQKEVEAVMEEDGEIHYYAETDGVIQELKPVVNEDGTVTYEPITDDLPKEMPEIPQDVKQQAVPDKSVTTPPDPVTQTVNRTINESKLDNSDAAPKSTTVSVKTEGTDKVAGLQTAIGSVQGKSTVVEAKAKGESKVRTLANAINAVHGKAVNVSASISGTSAETFNTLAASIGRLKDKSITVTTHKKTVEDLFGTARSSGTAFAKGTLSNDQTNNIVRSNSWKTSKAMDALTGEVGQELVVTGNRWFTVGDNGAEFAHIPKGAVVFNAEQTEQLFSKGYINSRGSVKGQLRYPSSSATFLDGSIDDELDGLNEIDSLDAFLSGNAFSGLGGAKGPDPGNDSSNKSSSKSSASKKTSNPTKKKNPSRKKRSSSKKKTSEPKSWKNFEKWLDKLFDWMEIRLDRLSRQTEKWTDAAENAVTLSAKGGTWGEGGAKTTRKLGTKKNPINYTTSSMDSTTNKAIQATRKEYLANAKAEDLYEKQAQEVRKKALQRRKKKKPLFSKKQQKAIKNAYKALKSGKKVNIAQYGEKTKTVIEEMQSWIEKSLEAETKTTELQQQLADLYRQRFDNIQEWYEMVRGYYTDRASTEESFINARNAKGEKIVSSDYMAQRGNLQTALNKSRAEYDRLYKELDSQVKARRVVEGTTVWYEMRDELEKVEAQVYDDTEALANLDNEMAQLDLDQLQDVIDRISSVIDRLADASDVIKDIGNTTWNRNNQLPNLQTLYQNEGSRTKQALDLTLQRREKILAQMGNVEVDGESWNKLKEELDSVNSSAVSYLKSLTDINEKNRELNWKPFKDGMESLEHYRDELSTIQDFLNEDNLIAENGLLTDEGWANIALMAKQMELSEDAIYNNRKALKKLKEEYDNGVISQDKLTEESRNYCDAIANEAKNLEDYKSKILDAYIDSLEKQNDLLQENIDKRKDALSKVKDYYDYQRTISEKSKDINYLQQQIAALEGVKTCAYSFNCWDTLRAS